MKILGEMKSRNVFRIGMAYIVASWILIQLGYIVALNYAAPDWVMGVVITLLVCGFPVALYFTWTFALTTDGLRKESDLRKHDHLVRRSGDTLDVITMALLAGAFLLQLQLDWGEKDAPDHPPADHASAAATAAAAHLDA